MFNQSFDETIYRIIESEDVSSKTGELKQRIDREPEFRAAFDQTKKTVASLQGLAAKPALPREATFTQRDVDKLTRDILKGYRSKFAEVLSELGLAYYFELPQAGFGHLHREPLATPEDSRLKLKRAQDSYKSLIESADDTLTKINRLDGVLDSQGLASRSFACFEVSRSLRPNNASQLVRESILHLKVGNFDRAEVLSRAALDLARTSSEKSQAVASTTLLLLITLRFEDARSLVSMQLNSNPGDLGAQYNHALLNICFRETEKATNDFGRVLATFVTNGPMLSKLFKSGLLSVGKGDPGWNHFKADRVEFSRFVKYVETYLGSDMAVLAEGVV